MPLSVPEAAQQFVDDQEIHHAIVHGPASGAGSTVVTEGGSRPTLAKAVADAVGTLEETASDAAAAALAYRNTAGSHAADADADRVTVAADKAIVAADKGIVAADKAIVAADKGIVAADKAIVAADKATTITAKDDAQAAAAAALAYAGTSQQNLPKCIAGGTADALTLNYTPDMVLTDLVQGAFRAIYPNATTTPTANVDGLGALTLKKHGGQALEAGNIKAGATYIWEYHSSGPYLEILNPSVSSDATGATGLFDISGPAAGQIKFPATQNPSSNANVLDDYEEFTWTPIDDSGAGLSLSAATGIGTKIGNRVFANCTVTYPSTANGNTSAIGGFPFVVHNSDAARAGGKVGYTNLASVETFILSKNATNGLPMTAGGGTLTNAALSGGTMYLGLDYQAA